ncbi:pollen-specific leucine-rich repeat extensin-like protein 1 isoform X2 [Cyclopterus lumpus]|uniref:pollen-specific leucine-rich repeat extensin-like protein 1 isoform X2 n=1 Tax=Cyclopterus lumpus TaxID=8103 RepID=UPI001486C6D8|nr:pollen-specific leucine-rich repeat extensin-like protein 1 isoform X2 [Cyclopterus lumpus]
MHLWHVLDLAHLSTWAGQLRLLQQMKFSSESFQGFAVPTPKVPLLPSINGQKINSSVGGDHLSNGSVRSVPDLGEEGIFVPPPPAMAPPPPPGTFIPPPDFMGDLNSLNVATLPSPSMPDPKPISLGPFIEGEDLTFIKPPPMAPPKPPPKLPSTSSSGSVSSGPISSPPPAKVPERPTFSPPMPPSERQLKNPPPKPIRLSSISNFDSPPGTPAPPPPVQTARLSSFNPQNAAKLYHVPQTSILSGYEEHDKRRTQMLLLEDSVSVDSVPVLVQVDGKVPKVATPYKPAPKIVEELKENLQITQPSKSPPPEPKTEAKKGTVSVQPKEDQPLQTPQQTSPQLLKLNGSRVNSEPIRDKYVGSPSQSRRFSPILDHKLRNLKSGETNGARDGPAASPLALLLAAKERDKHKSSHPLSRENSGKMIAQPSASIHPSDTRPNSFIVTPRSSSSSSLTSLERIQESLMSVSPVDDTQTIQDPVKSSSPALVRDVMPSVSRTAASPSTTNLVVQKLKASQSPSNYQHTQPEDLSMALLPPPPEFDDFDGVMEPPPSVPTPDPPMKMAPTVNEIPLPPSHVPPPPSHVPPPPSHVPPPPPKLKAPAAPKLPPLDFDFKPKLQPMMKPKLAPVQLPSTISPSQATLLSILQKKMLEMDHKMAPANEAESTSDDWGTPLPDEDNNVPVVHRAAPQSKNYPEISKAATLNMRELESKVVKKYKETSSVKVPTSNGTESKHKYGMTFTVRPGTKQPISLVSKGDP